MKIKDIFDFENLDKDLDENHNGYKFLLDILNNHPNIFHQSLLSVINDKLRENPLDEKTIQYNLFG